MHSGGLIFCLLMMFCLLAFQAEAQKSGLHIVSLGQSWKIDGRAGTTMMLSEVPSQYLDVLNDVNIPHNVPGLNASFTLRKAFTGHLEMGYQLNYVNLSGNVYQDMKSYRVNTQALEHNYLLQLNLKRTDYYRPHYNAFAYYKIMAISLKNYPRERMSNGQLETDPKLWNQTFFVDNAGVGHGIGLGFNHQLSSALSLVSTLEYCRTANTASDIYKINKLFYDASSTVNNYVSFAFGVSYHFDLVKPRSNSPYARADEETERRLKLHNARKLRKRMAKHSRNYWQ